MDKSKPNGLDALLLTFDINPKTGRKVLAAIAIPVGLILGSTVPGAAEGFVGCIRQFNENFDIALSGTAYFGLYTATFGSMTLGCAYFSLKELVANPIIGTYKKLTAKV